jgi:hypothetical protein
MLKKRNWIEIRVFSLLPPIEIADTGVCGEEGGSGIQALHPVYLDTPFLRNWYSEFTWATFNVADPIAKGSGNPTVQRSSNRSSALHPCTFFDTKYLSRVLPTV